MNLESIVHEIQTWPVKDRLRLIEQVWGSISSETQTIGLTDEQLADLQTRLQKHRQTPLYGSAWKEVEARLVNS